MESNTANTIDSSQNSQKPPSLRIYLLLAVSMMLFKAAETMYKTTINSYLYHWIYEKGRESNYTDLILAINTTTVPEMCYPNLTLKRDQDIAQEKADKHQTKLLLVASTLSLVSLMVYGCLSDYFGRKIIFVACVGGYIIQICVACVIVNHYAHINFLYFAYVADGLGGSAFGFSLGCFLSLTDIARTKNEKVLGLALIDSLIGIGGITTKYSTTLYLQKTNYNYPLFTACGFCVLLLFTTLIFVDDTLSISKQSLPSLTVISTEQAQKQTRIPSLKDLVKNVSRFYVGPLPAKTKAFFWLCFVMFCLAESPSVFRSDLVPLIQIGWPFCWTSGSVNLYTLSALGVTYIVGMMLVKPLQHCFSDTTIGSIGLLSAMAFNLLTAEAKSAIMLYIGLCCGTLMLVPKPVIRGLASKVAGAEKQGALFAGLLGSELICEVISDVIYMYCYAHQHGPIDGKIFLILGAVLVPCLGIMMLMRFKFRSVLDGEVDVRLDDIGRVSINYNNLQSSTEQ